MLGEWSHRGIAEAAHDGGLVLTAREAREIAEAEATCLAECGRVSFGEGAAVRIVREFATSPFLVGHNTARTLRELIEAFYELREDLPSSITDAEILEALRDPFDGEAAGDADLAASLACDSLLRWDSNPTYAIADDAGGVYRWDPEEWRDDVTADGWYGERWEDADE